MLNLLHRGYDTTKDKLLDMRGRVALDLAILNGAKETQTLFRGECVIGTYNILNCCSYFFY